MPHRARVRISWDEATRRYAVSRIGLHDFFKTKDEALVFAQFEAKRLNLKILDLTKGGIHD